MQMTYAIVILIDQQLVFSQEIVSPFSKLSAP